MKVSDIDHGVMIKIMSRLTEVRSSFGVKAHKYFLEKELLEKQKQDLDKWMDEERKIMMQEENSFLNVYNSIQERYNIDGKKMRYDLNTQSFIDN